MCINYFTLITVIIMPLDSDISKPLLIEPGVKYFLNETLKQCHGFKEKHRNMLFNVGVFTALCIVLGIVLLIKYKGKPTQPELEQKELEKKQYILSKIRNFQDARRREQQELITGLPHWDTEYDMAHEKITNQL